MARRFSPVRLLTFDIATSDDCLRPIINMVQALVTEFKPPPGLDSKSPTTTGKATPITFTLDVRVSRFDVTLQITHGMWLAWNFTKIVVGFGNNINDRSLSVMQGTLGIESQSISVESSSTGTLGEDGVLAVKLVLPSLKLLTIATASRIRAQVEVEYFKMQLKPTHFDDLLMAQRHLGSTFDGTCIVALTLPLIYKFGRSPKIDVWISG